MSTKASEIVVKFNRAVTIDALNEYGARALTALAGTYQTEKIYNSFRIPQKNIGFHFLDPNTKSAFRGNRTKTILVAVSEEAIGLPETKKLLESFVQILDALVKASS